MQLNLDTQLFEAEKMYLYVSYAVQVHRTIPRLQVSDLNAYMINIHLTEASIFKKHLYIPVLFPRPPSP